MNAVEHARKLIAFDSTWYRSNRSIAEYLESLLRNLDFQTERIEYLDDEGTEKVNIVARRGKGPGGLAYFGHNDVVTTSDWSIKDHGPFEPVMRDDRLYGRGSTDMKGSIACILAAVESLAHHRLNRPLYISLSSDEEINHRGAIEIAQRSALYRQLVEGKACGIVGEPTEMEVVHAHKGGCRATITSRGLAAHSSTGEGINAHWAMIPFLVEMKTIRDQSESDPAWKNNEFVPPTICLNIGINDHTKAANITVPQSICSINFRPMPGTDAQGIIDRVQSCSERLGLEFQIENHHPAFWRSPTSDFVQQCLQITGGREPRTVAFGSEASNFVEVEKMILLGPGSIAQAHKSDEWISLEQLHRGEETFRKLIETFCL